MPYLLQISVGPVQEFIARSRRLRDLWYSSWLISAVSKAIALHLQAHTRLIFPAATADLQPFSATNVANKIVALTQETPVTPRPLMASSLSYKVRSRQHVRLSSHGGKMCNASFPIRSIASLPAHRS